MRYPVLPPGSMSVSKCYYDKGKIMIREDEAKYISKKMSYALRHNPEKYGIELDEEGYTDLKKFLRAMNAMHHFQPGLTREDIRFVMDHLDKQRFEMTDTKIRALYGHSVPALIRKEKADPPAILYHGTAHRFLNEIMEEGLLPMSRQYVHLSVDVETARQVGARRDAHPAILKVHAGEARDAGVEFFVGNSKVWLSEPIPAIYLELLE